MYTSLVGTLVPDLLLIGLPCTYMYVLLATAIKRNPKRIENTLTTQRYCRNIYSWRRPATSDRRFYLKCIGKCLTQCVSAIESASPLWYDSALQLFCTVSYNLPGQPGRELGAFQSNQPPFCDLPEASAMASAARIPNTVHSSREFHARRFAP